MIMSEITYLTDSTSLHKRTWSLWGHDTGAKERGCLSESGSGTGAGTGLGSGRGSAGAGAGAGTGGSSEYALSPTPDHVITRDSM